MAASELTQWLDAAGRIPRITPAQEIMLARQVQAARALPAEGRSPEQERIARRAKRAQQRLAEANLRLVYRIVHGQYRRLVPSHQLIDLLQCGAEGAFHAASKFDPEAGYRFSTYAACWIRQRCQQELDRVGRPIRPPSTITPQLRRLPKVRARLLQTLGRPPTVEELAEGLGLSPEETELALQRNRPMASLDAPCGDDGSLLGDLIAAPSTVPQPLAEVPPELASLSGLERRALMAAHGLGVRTLAEMAEQEDLPLPLLRQVARRAAQRLRGQQLPPVPVAQSEIHTIQLQLWRDQEGTETSFTVAS